MVQLHSGDAYTILDEQPELEKRVCIEMALSTKRQRPPPAPYDAMSSRRVIGFRFVWSDYPELLEILVDAMEEYLRAPVGSDMAGITASLIQQIRKRASRLGCVFDSQVTDVALRNRIRGYYIQQIQTARQRLLDIRTQGIQDEQVNDILKRLHEKRRRLNQSPCSALHDSVSSCSNSEGSPAVPQQEAVGGGADMETDRVPSRKRCMLDPKPALPQTKTLSPRGQELASNVEPRKRSKKSPEDKEENVKAGKSAAKAQPREGSYEWQVSERLREISIDERATKTHMDVAQEDRDEDTTKMLAFVRFRLASGAYRSAILSCHDVLQRLYREVCAIFESGHPDESSIVEAYRAKLTSAWCLYAQILYEVGSVGKHRAEKTAQSRKGQTSASSSSVSTNNDWKDYAIATLVCATCCPLVGNNEHITVALSRMLVGGEQKGPDSTSISENYRDALSVCKDGLRRARSATSPQAYSPIPLNEMDFARMARHQLKDSAFKNDPITVAQLEASFGVVMDLPQLLLPSDEHYFLVDGRNGVQTILAEINRLNSVHRADSKNPLYTNKESPGTTIDGSTHETDSTGSSSTASSTTKSSEHEDEEAMCSLCNNVLVRERNIAQECMQCGNTSVETCGKQDVMVKSDGIT